MSGWVATRYAPTAEFGRREGEDIADVWGVAALSNGEVVVLDAGNTRVLHLTADLALRRSSGRAGRGPGEFPYQRVTHGDWAVGIDSSVVVVTFNGLQRFGPDGFEDFISHKIFPLSIKRMAWSGLGLLYATDSVDTVTGSRLMATSIVESGEPRKLRLDPMPTLPHHEGRPVMGAFVNQADPLWAGSADCVFLSDGSSNRIVRVDLKSGSSDTISLPAREPPRMTPADERELESVRRLAASMGIRSGSSSVRPTAPLVWNNMLVDPSGFIWIEPWRPSSSKDDPVVAWIVDPALATVDSVRLEVFPTAFLPDSSYVALQVDPQTHVKYLVKYARS